MSLLRRSSSDIGAGPVAVLRPGQGWAAVTSWICVFLSACAAAPIVSYPLKEGEIFIAPRPHLLNVAVVVLEDQRPPHEKDWARLNRLSDFTGDLSIAVTEQIVRHLRASAVFNEVQILSGPVALTSLSRGRKLISQGIDAVLVGELVHYYGKTRPDRQIEGHVQFAGLKLYSLHTGQILYEGELDKSLRRVEQHPMKDTFYASEALRGAVNQLAVQVAGLSWSHQQVYPSGLPPVRQWWEEVGQVPTVGVLLPEDLRPSEEKDVGERKLQGNPDYFLYSDTIESVNKPILCGFIITCSAPITEAAPFVDEVAEQWVKQLQAAKVFGNVLVIKTRGETFEELQEWAGEGVDAILVSQLTHAFASVVPPYDSRPFPIWSGGMGFPRRFRVSALTRFEDVRLVSTRNGKVLWEGEAEYGIDRSGKKWESPINVVRESLEMALNRLVRQLSQLVPVSAEKSPAP